MVTCWWPGGENLRWIAAQHLAADLPWTRAIARLPTNSAPGCLSGEMEPFIQYDMHEGFNSRVKEGWRRRVLRRLAPNSIIITQPVAAYLVK